MTPFRVSVQKSDFRGLGATVITDSGGMLGRAGVVDSWRAADVGKYILDLKDAREGASASRATESVRPARRALSNGLYFFKFNTDQTSNGRATAGTTTRM